MYDTDSNVTITGANSGISTTLNGAITSSATSLTLTSVSLFPSSATSGSIHLKIGDEIVTGTISGTTVSSLTRGVDKMVQLFPAHLMVQRLNCIKSIMYH